MLVYELMNTENRIPKASDQIDSPVSLITGLKFFFRFSRECHQEYFI